MKSTLITRLAVVLLLSAATSPAQTYKVLYNFGAHAGDPSNSYGAISQGRHGYLYTSADDFYTDGIGSAFSLTTTGQLTVLHRFNVSDGQAPVGGLTLGTDGYYYGTTRFGGDAGFGTIFKMNAQGAVTTLYSFTGGDDGGWACAAPVQSIGGDFFGTSFGSENTSGSIYKISASGIFTLLHVFNGSDGYRPCAPLVQAADGDFYGTTFGGGYGYGTIFRISRWGDFTVVYQFDSNHGAYPTAPLVQGADGNFYGVTRAGGSSGTGVAFKLKPHGNVIVLHNFTGGSDGSDPVAGLVQATDGNFYGTTNSGGPYNIYGVLFRMSSTGVFKVLHNFSPTTEWGAETALVQHTNGILYGTTGVGGSGGVGTFYSLNLNLAPFVRFLPASTYVGSKVHILGQGFNGATEVSFNGVPSTFSVIYDTYLVATVPGGATSGYITVMTPTGALKSDKEFTILP